jgi:hypothetical protein
LHSNAGEQLQQYDVQQYRATAQQLKLSLRQQQRIATALRFFKQLTDSALSARQQLQQRLQDNSPQVTAAEAEAAAIAAGSPAEAASAGAAAAAAAARDCHGQGIAAAFKSQRAVLQQQELDWGLQQRRQQQLSRLQMLMRKEAVLKHCFACCIQGCLTWKQMAQVGRPVRYIWCHIIPWFVLLVMILKHCACSYIQGSLT